MAEGQRPQLEQFVVQLQEGPRGAYVTDVKVEWMASTGEFDSFRIAH
jgi:acylphosphatase